MIVKNVEKKENNSASFQVAADAAEFEKAVNAAYLKNKGQISIPGFRKGKAPRAVVEGMYGKEVFYQDAMDELAPKAFEQGLQESGLRMVGAPAISDVQLTEDKGVEYTFAITLYPEVTLGQYKELTAEKSSVVVTDEEIDNEVKAVQKRNARKVSVDDRPAAMGDTANIDFDGYLDGVPFDGGKADGFDLELGSGTFVPGFEEQVAGMSVGEEKDIDITFPEDYAESLAGKAVVFKVKLNSITFPELPELDDEFAKDISEFDTLDEYKADLRAKMEKKKADDADGEVKSDLIKQAADNMTVELPDVMVDEKVEEILRNYAANFGMTDRNVSLDELKKMMGVDEQVINASIRPAAVAQVRNDLLFEAIVKAEDFPVSDEEAEEYAKKIAESIGADAEQVKEYFGMDYIKDEKRREMATEIIFSTAVITEKAE